MKRRKGGLLANLALAMMGLLLAFAVPEAILRWAQPSFTQDMFGTARDHLPGLQAMVADTEQYTREHDIRQPPSFIAPSDLIWSLKPGYDEIITRIPWVEGETRTYRVHVNALGFRGDEIAPEKKFGALRVVCLGDSIIFGDKLDGGDTISVRMAEILAARSPGRPVELINAGVPGYSSRQGLALWRQRIGILKPDVVIIAFGFNDRWPSNVEDSESFAPDIPVVGALIGALRSTETYRALRALILGARRRLEPAREKSAGAKITGTRVPIADTERNIQALVREVHAAGAIPVVVHTARGEAVVGEALARVAHEEGAAFVDAAGALEEARVARQRSVAASLGVTQPCPDPGDVRSGVVFRVRLPPAIPREGDLVLRTAGDVGLRKIALADDGRGCDEAAGDSVWSGRIEADAGARIHYVYAQRRPGGFEVDEFAGFPWVWRTRVAGPVPGEAGPATVETYNRFDFLSEEIHPDAEGAALIARAIAKAIPLEELGP
ncbi:MAG: SGNH/GDSL hydrolase family protein [Deltaproteobacteria bacterium]|nr:SGNH/GDSL hydrolase family protein [Deltaproteobacteria bacterium]